MTTPAIRLENVSKRYGRQPAVDGIDIAVAPGTFVALLGHNGVGKTTLIKLMLGLIRPSEGRVAVLGIDPASAAAMAQRRRVGFLPENISFYEQMTGAEALTFYARLKRVPITECGPLLDRVGLTDAAGRRIRTYSKGMRQRLGLAQALLGEPRLLFLDEPTTGLDPLLRQAFFRMVGALTESGTTVVLSSHALTELEARTDRVIMLDRGRLVADGDVMALSRAARLPMRIRVTAPAEAAASLSSGLDADATLTRVNGHAFELTFPVDAKMAVLRRVAGMGAVVDDIEIRPPSLDDLYDFYLGEGDRP